MEGDDWGRGGETETRRSGSLQEKPRQVVSMAWRWTFGPKGLKRISIFGWLKKVREMWNIER